MLKSLLTLLTSSASLVALLLFTNTAKAAPIATDTVSEPSMPRINLNVVSSELNFANYHQNVSEDLGCSCPLCSQIMTTSSTD